MDMAFESLQQKLTKTIRNIQGKGKLSERNMEETLQEIRVALLEADVNYTVVKEFLEKVKEESLGHDVLNSVEPGQMLVKIVHDELIKVLGSETDAGIKFKDGGITTIMVVGLQGTGKTTHVAKIANQLKKQGKNPIILAGDLIRSAAIEQLETLGKKIDVEVYAQSVNSKAINVAKDGLAYAKAHNYDTVLIDTAGRLQIDEVLMKELKDIKNAVKPDEILLTVDALTGQDIANVAKTFNDLLDITGLIVTKFDGDSKGGAVLSVKAVTGVPVKFTGVGEKIEDLEAFHPDRLAERMLGMGDVVSLVEKAQEKFDQEKAEEAMKHLMAGKYTLDDVLVSLEQTAKMGSISKLIGMVPGMSDIAPQVNDDDANKRMKITKAIIQSMTAYEKAHPEELRGSHKRRIAMGSGTSIDEVNKLIKTYEKMQKLAKVMPSMMSRFK